MLSRVRGSDNGRYLVDEADVPQFLNVDTAWGLFCLIRREDVLHYLAIRQQQSFNGVAACALFFCCENAYGQKAFESDSGRPDPARLITSGARDGSDGDPCSFWEHVDWVVDQVRAHGMYLILLPAWGNLVAGNWTGKDTSDIIFEPGNAYIYGKFIGSRYRNYDHIIWMLGGDRSAIYAPDKDYRKVFAPWRTALGMASTQERTVRRVGAAS